MSSSELACFSADVIIQLGNIISAKYKTHQPFSEGLEGSAVNRNKSHRPIAQKATEKQKGRCVYACAHACVCAYMQSSLVLSMKASLSYEEKGEMD